MNLDGVGRLLQAADAVNISPNRHSGPWMTFEKPLPDLGRANPEVGEMYVPNPQFVAPETGGGWARGVPQDTGPQDERAWREVKFSPQQRRFYHPDTDEDAGNYEWAHFRPDRKMYVSTILAQALEVLAAGAKVKEPKSDSPWMDKHGFSQDVLNSNALAWWDRMTPQQQHEAHYWYPVYHEWATEQAARKGIHPDKGAGVVAATSPLRRWDGNLQDAHNFLTHYPHAPENIKKPPGLSAAANIKRAQRVYDAPDDPAAIRSALSESKDPNSAKKILSFHDLGVNPEHGGAYNHADQPVVIDSWMPRGILLHPDQAEQYNSEDINLVPESLRDRKVKKVRKQNPETGVWEDQGHRDPNIRDVGLWALNNKGGYERMANALRHVAAQRNLPFAHVAQAGIWNRLGGTANPDGSGDQVAEHPAGPLTHIQDPHALYDAMWNRQVNQPKRQLQPVALARGDYHIDDDWDHLKTPHSKVELAVAHGRLPYVPEEEEQHQTKRIINDAKVLVACAALVNSP